MARYSRRSRSRSRRGGEKIDDIQEQLDNIQQEVNKLKSSSSSSMSDNSMPGSMSDNSMPMSMSDNSMSDNSMPMSMSDNSMPMSMSNNSMAEETVKVDKTWVSDKDKKFRDGAGGRVSLAFGRIMTLLDNNIKKGDTKKAWSTIKEKLADANSVGEVQDVIDTYKVSFASNYVAGTRRRKRNGKKRTQKRR